MFHKVLDKLVMAALGGGVPTREVYDELIACWVYYTTIALLCTVRLWILLQNPHSQFTQFIRRL